MGLVEETKNSIPILETSHSRTGCDDCAGAIGGGDYGKVNWEAIFALQETEKSAKKRRHMGEA